MKIRLLCLLMVLFLSAPQSGWSQTDVPAPAAPRMSSAPTRDDLKVSLLSSWEEAVSKDPDTLMFKKTDTPGVYYLQTDLLPYKGRIKVTNLLIRPYTPTADYDRRIAYSGIVEIALMDPYGAPINKDSVSTKEWERLGWFNYDKSTLAWFPTKDWQQHFPNARHVQINTPMSVSNDPSFIDIIVMVSEVTFGIFFVVFLGFAVIYGYRQQKIRNTMNEHTQILRDIKDILADIRAK